MKPRSADAADELPASTWYSAFSPESTGHGCPVPSLLVAQGSPFAEQSLNSDSSQSPYPSPLKRRTPVPDGVEAPIVADVTASEFVISGSVAGSSPSRTSSRKPWSITDRWSYDVGSPLPSV